MAAQQSNKTTSQTKTKNGEKDQWFAIAGRGFHKSVVSSVTVSQHRHSHGGQHVVGGVGVGVDSAVERLGGVLAQGRADQGSSTGVFLDEGLDVVDDAVDQDQAVGLGALGESLAVPDGQVADGHAPSDLASEAVELLSSLSEDASVDSVSRERLEVPGQAEERQEPDRHLGGVESVPLEGVSVVGGELVVEVVVALAEGDQSGHDVVTGRSAVIKRSRADVVRQRVDAEGGSSDDKRSENAGVDKAAPVVAPEVARNADGQHVRRDDHEQEVVAVSERHHPVGRQVRDVGSGPVARVRFGQHPAHVRVPQASASVVGVLLGVGVTVVHTVRVGPPLDGASDGAGPEKGVRKPHRRQRLVRLVSKAPVVAGGDREPARDVEHEHQRQGVGVWAVEKRRVDSVRWDGHHQHKVQPVHVSVPVAECPGSLGDVLGGGASAALLQDLQILRESLGRDVHERLGAHQLAAETGSHDSGVLFVDARRNCVERRQIHSSKSHDECSELRGIYAVHSLLGRNCWYIT